MSTPTTTVLIPTFNRARYLGECLESICGQSTPPDQVMLVDDGSTDETASVVAKFGARVEYIKKENGGKASAINFALPRVRGEVVWIFDDDDLAVKDVLARHLDALARAPHAGFTYGGYIWFHDEPDGTRKFEHVVQRPQVAPEDLFLTLLDDLTINQQAMAIRRGCFDKIGPYDTSYLRGDDYEIIVRLARHFDGVPVEGPTFYRRDHPGVRGAKGDVHSATQNADRWYMDERKLFAELYPKLDLAEYLPRALRRTPLGPAERRRALLQRSCAMSRRALWDQALADLTAAVAIDAGPLSAAEQGICAAAFDAARAIRLSGDLQNPAGRIAALPDAPLAREVRAHLGRGLLRCAKGELRAGNVNFAMSLLRHVPELAGVAGLTRLATYKLGVA